MIEKLKPRARTHQDRVRCPRTEVVKDMHTVRESKRQQCRAVRGWVEGIEKVAPYQTCVCVCVYASPLPT